MYKVSFYRDHRGRYPVYDFIEELNDKSQACVYRNITLLSQYGPNLLRPHADYVREKIRELRVKTIDGNIRIFYFFFIEHRVILLHAFKKKSEELPEREIEQAMRCMNDLLERFKEGKYILTEEGTCQ